YRESGCKDKDFIPYFPNNSKDIFQAISAIIRQSYMYQRIIYYDFLESFLDHRAEKPDKSRFRGENRLDKS
ncbi:hypothetical protein, partial [uncultured Alistipes sp.]|uniref:hypothetical protein n=1 Tax=uncultured Alistipes sp. TaxID=538949 RepID=UPI00262C784F